MKPLSVWIDSFFHQNLLRAASLLVPVRQRVEWGREWSSELWHVRQSCVPEGLHSWRAEREITAFCLGAFQDAVSLRRHAWKTRAPLPPLRGSASLCLFVLAVALTACSGVALLLPGVRAAYSLARRPVDPGLVLIQNAASKSDRPSIPVEQFRSWSSSKQKYFDGLAFYKISQESVSTTQAGWEVAHASTNLFSISGVPIRYTGAENTTSGDLPRVILSDAVWKRDFAGKPNIAGSPVRVGGIVARIAGVAPKGSWRLPGKVDAWLLQPSSAFSAEDAGFVVAHLTPVGKVEMWAPRLQIAVAQPDDSNDEFLAVCLNEGMPLPWAVFGFAVILAFLALPATTCVSMGESSFSSQRPSWSRRLNRWGFLAAKIALLLPIAYFASMDIGYCCATPYSPTSVYLNLASAFSVCLFGLRWALLDQLQRCPICLRSVAHPAQVGYSSRTFLAWSGTELICMDGHTLLHVPGLPTSWFSTQRWLYLDTSWDFLFMGPTSAPEKELLTGF